MRTRLFAARAKAPRPARIPANTRLYAIGDVHGRLDLLRELRATIRADAERGLGLTKIVHLGDYVDRGLESRGVLDALCSEPLAGFESVFLMGNHDEMMLRFLTDPSVGPNWFFNGGDATLYSYGIDSEPAPGEGSPARFARLSRELNERLPDAHQAFLRSLRLAHVEGDYYFVHAGVRPGVPLARQSDEDLLWIRDEFLSSKMNFGKIVVHGHTPTIDADVRSNRIGIDTGAYFSGVLTCLVLEDDRRRLIQTAPRH